MRIIRRAIIVGTVASSALLGPMLSSGRALAAVPVDTCHGKSQESVVKVYYRGALAIPLRCGSLTYGFLHVVDRGRWNDTYDADIALTIARGEANPDGTIYSWFDDQCVETFRVNVNPGAFRGTEFRPQGVITAYYPTYPTAVAFRGDSEPRPAVRTDCPIFVPVNTA